MKIIYLGNFENPWSDSTEKHIANALEKFGHEVVRVNAVKYSMQDVLGVKDPDLFLFHKGGTQHGVPLPMLVEMLNKITCKKVFWWFDKVMDDRHVWMETIIPFVDHGFLTDETWVRRHNYKNLSILRQGIGDDSAYLGEFRERYKQDIVFLGSVYGERERFVNGLKEVYGDRFKVVNGVFGKRLNDLCASTKIFVAPRFPSDEFYWSSRVYQIAGSGGFLIHPRLTGLQEEYTNGVDMVMYRDGQDLREKIDYYLEHEDEREKIRLASFEKTKANYKYSDRVKTLLEVVQGL